MNPLQILLSFWRLWGRKNFKRNGHFSGDSSHTLGMTFGLLPAKNVVILNGMQWSEESPKKWVYCEISHIRSRWQICHSECSVSGMKNLKQIAEDSSYSFGMISGQKPRIRSEWHDCHSDDHREEESPTKKVRAKWKTSWIEALRVRCFAVAQHDRVFWGFLAYARNDKKEGRTNAPLSYIKQSSDYSTMSFCV